MARVRRNPKTLATRVPERSQFARSSEELERFYSPVERYVREALRFGRVEAELL